jgi:regulator of sirC expression with transglutaminase-like and TPR domain
MAQASQRCSLAEKMRSYAELLRSVMKDAERAEVFDRLATVLDEAAQAAPGGAGG